MNQVYIDAGENEDWLKALADGRFQRADLAAHDAALAKYRLERAKRLRDENAQTDAQHND